MKNAIIIHGYSDKSDFLDTSRPAASNDHWLPWLQRQLLLQSIEAQTPEMPGFYEPHYDQWKAVIDMHKPTEETMLIGHSCGGGCLVRWLSETDQHVGKVVLVAPWLDPNKTIDPAFFDFTIDPTIVSRTKNLTIMYSTDDASEILKSIEMLKEKILDATFMEFTNKGHFCLRDLGTEEFPELLERLLD